MAQSRLEKVGTIYTRISALLKTGAMKEENKPLWLDIYKAFPPKYEPRFDRPSSNAPLKQIFYSEDKIRAKFHSDYQTYSQINMLDSSSTSKTELFLEIHRKKERDGLPESETYEKAVEEFLTKMDSEKPIQRTREVSQIESKEATERQEKDVVDLESLFTESDWKTDAQNRDNSSQSTEESKPIRLSLEKLMEDMKDEEGKS